MSMALIGHAQMGFPNGIPSSQSIIAGYAEVDMNNVS
jgi:hypothetical protein